MTELEKDVLENFAAVLPLLDEESQKKLLWAAKGIILVKQDKMTKKEDAA